MAIEGPPDTSPPSVPTNLSATAASSSQINLSWNASTDNIGVTGYKIFRNGTQIATSTMTSYQNTGLTPSTTYSYTVLAYDAAGNNSALSSTATATTLAPPDTTPPSVPAGLTATAVSPTQINLTWNVSTDNVAVAGYKIYRNESQVGTLTGTFYQDTGLAPSTTYSYTVSAYDSAGNNSSRSAPATATTIPSPPTGLTATPGNAQVALSWTGSSGVSTYNVKRARNSGGPYNDRLVTGLTGTTYLDFGLTNGTTYFYVVSAVKGSGESNNSSEVSAQPQIPILPQPSVNSINPSSAANTVPVSIVTITGSGFTLGWDRENGLVGNWRMDETSGANATDSSGYHNNGAASGPAIVAGKLNNARTFSTDADTVMISNAPSLNGSGGFTVGFWIKLSSGSDANVRQIFVKGTGAVGSREPAIFLGLASGCGGDNRLLYQMDLTGGSNQGPCGNTSLNTGTWYHVAMVYDPSAPGVFAYINGMLDATATTSGGPSPNTANLYIGGSPAYPSFRGSLDEVRFYNRALSDLEIYQLYMATGPGTIALTKAGQAAVACSGFIYASATSLRHGSCNIKESAVGTWNVEVRNPNNPNGTLNDGFSVLGPPPHLYFDDVPQTYPYYSQIDNIVTQHLTAGCSSSPPLYCPDSYVTREQAAIFIERGMSVFTPPWPAGQRFNDVAEEQFSYAFIDDFAYRGFTAGCSTNPPLYCPNSFVTREQLAIFLERAVGRTNPPTPYSQRFVDVDPSAWSYNWVDSFVSHGMNQGVMDVIKRGCNADGAHYCPTQAVTRGEMAAFLAIAFGW